MFDKYSMAVLKFVKIRSISDTYVYLGAYSDKYDKIYIPSLKRSFYWSEVTYISDLDINDIAEIARLEKNIRYDVGDFGEDASYYRKDIKEADVKKLEKYRNKPKKPSREDRRYIGR